MLLGLSAEWVSKLDKLPKNCFNARVVDVFLKDGRVFTALVEDYGSSKLITRVMGCGDDIPFSIKDIEDIKLAKGRFDG